MRASSSRSPSNSTSLVASFMTDAALVAVVVVVVEVEVEAVVVVSDFEGTRAAIFFFLVHIRLSGSSESSADVDFRRFLELVIVFRVDLFILEKKSWEGKLHRLRAPSCARITCYMLHVR